jgi:hypothetical protein
VKKRDCLGAPVNGSFWGRGGKPIATTTTVARGAALSLVVPVPDTLEPSEEVKE